jgi:predicted amidohydrolase YtcJ
VELLVEEAVVVTMASPGTMPGGSLLVRDGRIAAVGPAEAVRAAAERNAQVVRLDGATIVPGLIDAHCHVADVGYLAAAADCSQPSAPDIPAIQARLREAGQRTPEGSWVTGGGYAQYKLREGRHPTRADLDQAVPGRPAVVYHTSLHAAVLNTPALREAGFADGQPDPPGGAFGRDTDGRLDGVVYERPMFALFERNLREDLARMGAAARARLVRMAGQQMASFGLTAACEADMRRDSFAAFAEADAGGELSLRVYGLVVHDHVDWLLASGLRGRHSGRLATQAAELGIVVVSQPGFLSALGDGFAEAFGDRSDQLYCFGSWQRAGLTVAGSSDAPVITADPLVGIRDAMLRRTGHGRVLGPAERLPARDALALYTTKAAFASHRETEAGSLEPGKLADFVVLDRNPLEADAEQIPDIEVLATVLDGVPVYQSVSVFPGE